MIRPAQTVSYLRIDPAVNPQLSSQFDSARLSGRIETDVCYCSVFEDCWTRTSRD